MGGGVGVWNVKQQKDTLLALPCQIPLLFTMPHEDQGGVGVEGGYKQQQQQQQQKTTPGQLSPGKSVQNVSIKCFNKMFQ